MSTLLARPNADGSISQHSPSTGSDNYAMVDETSSDDDTTYLKTPSGGFGTRDDTFTFDLSSIGDSDTINSVTVYAVCRQGPSWSSDNISFNLRDGILNQIGGATAPSASYTEESHEFNSGNVANFPTDGDDLKTNFEMGVRSSSGNLGDDDIRYTQIWVVIDYTPTNASSDERAGKVTGQDVASGERGGGIYGFDGRYVEHFTSTTKKDAGNTTASWTTDGTAEMQ